MNLSTHDYELLNATLIKSHLSARTRQALQQLDVFAAINSTNSYLMECAKNSDQNGHVCFAEKQIQGKGSFGKSWESNDCGNLYFSLLWHFEMSIEKLPLISLAVGVIMAKALHKMDSQVVIQLKWPNDIWVNNKKLAGILIETVTKTPTQFACVIGIGFNLFPAGLVDSMGWLEVSKSKMDRNQFAAILIDSLITAFNNSNINKMEHYIERWNEYDMYRDKMVLIKSGTHEWPGLMKGINRKGHVIIENREGKQLTFKPGEISLIKPA